MRLTQKLEELANEYQTNADAIRVVIRIIASQNGLVSNHKEVLEAIRNKPLRKKKHWTQTAAGRKKVSQAMKAMWKAKKP